jgi:hypothetical protein
MPLPQGRGVKGLKIAKNRAEGYFRVLISTVEKCRRGKAGSLAFAFLEVDY